MPIDTYPAPVQSTPSSVLGYAETTAAQAGITTMVDLTGLAVSVSVPAGRMIRITGFIIQYSRTAGTVTYAETSIWEGATQLAAETHAIANTYGGGMASCILAPTAGAHTYKLRARTDGTVQLDAATTARNYILVEDITGGTGGPGPIQLAYAPMTVASQTFSAAADVTGCALTITVPAGRTIRLSGSAICQCDGTAGRAVIHIQEGATKVGRVVTEELVASAYVYASNSVIISPSAGTHTYRLVGIKETGAGIFTIVSDSQYPAYINAEDITGTPAPGGLLPSSQTLAYAQITANQGSITAPTDVTGLSVTVTVPAGRRIRVTGFATAQNTSAGVINALYVMESGTILEKALIVTGGVSLEETLCASAILSPSAGIHTYNLRADRSGGTMQVNGDAQHPSYILVEDITGGALPVPAASVPVGVLGQSTSVTAPTTASATLVDLGVSVNITVPAGRTLRIYARMAVTGPAGDIIDFYIRQDGVEVSGVTYWQDSTWGTTVPPNEVLLSPSAGSHTYTCVFRRASGAGTTTSQGCILYVFDETPTPAPATTAPSAQLAYAEATANQTGISTETDLTGLTVTVTVAAGRRLKITGSMYMGRTVADGVSAMRIKEGATQLHQADFPVRAAAEVQAIERAVVITPTAGTHTYKLTLALATGTGTTSLAAASTYPAYILVEDITGVALSTQGVIDTTPVATVSMTAATLAPPGWMICDGSAISRTGYPNLFAAIGTVYGTGDGSTTFNLPNLKGRVVVGYDASQTEFNAVAKTGGVKTLTLNEMPVHTHVQDAHGHLLDGRADDATSTGGWYNDVEQTTQGVQSAVNNGVNNATATNQNAGVGAAGGNLPPYMAMNYMIKVW